MIQSELCKILGIEYPVLQGPMAWISDASLAAAVSEAGGLGFIAGGNAPPENISKELKQIKSMTNKPFGLNVMLLSPYVEEIVQLAIEEKVPVVSTGAGYPGKYIQLFKDHGIKVVTVSPSVAMAKRMERDGVDVLVAEGMESGGHIGKITTMALVPQMVDAVKIPVVAAGGIGDGRGMAAAFMLGAQGIQMGTRFLLAHECTVHQNYKEKIIGAKDIDTTITGESTGHPVRVLRNKLTKQYLALEKGGATPAELEELGTGALRLAAVEGDMAEGSVMAGQIAGLVHKEQPAKEIILEIINECKEVIARNQMG